MAANLSDSNELDNDIDTDNRDSAHSGTDDIMSGSDEEFSPLPLGSEQIRDGDHWSMAAKKLFRAISVSNAPESDETFSRLLTEVRQKRKMSLYDVYQTLGLPVDNDESQLQPIPKRKSFVPLSSTISEEPIEKSPRRQKRSAPQLHQSSIRRQKFRDSRLAQVAQLLAIDSTDSGKVNLNNWDDIAKVMELDNLKGYVDSIVDYLISKLHTVGEVFLKRVFPYQEFSLYLFVCLAQIISFQSLLHFVPICICYGAFTSMVYWCLKLFHNMRVLQQLELWRQLLRVFVSDNSPLSPMVSDKPSTANMFYANGPPAPPSSPTSTDASEPTPVESHSGLDTFRWASAEPYANFFTSVFIFVLAFALTKYLPNGIFLCATSILFCFLTLFALTDRWDTLVWWSLLLDLVSSVPLVMRKFNLETPVLFNDIVMEPMGDIKVTLGLSSLAFALIPLTYAVVIIRDFLLDGSYGNVVRLYRTVATHLVILFWWQIGMMLLTSGGMILNLKSILLTGAVLSLVIFPTMLAVGIVVGLAISQLRDSLNVSNVLKAAFTVFILFVPFFYKKLTGMMERRSGHKFDLKSQRKVVIIVAFYIFMVVMSVSLLYHGTFIIDQPVSNLSWQQFEKHCGSKLDGDADNLIKSQLECSQLKGLVVSWRGTVGSVKVSAIDNSLEDLIGYLPGKMSEWLRCFYGTPNERQLLGSLNIQPNSCGISSHNVYSFEVLVSGPWGEHMISSAKGSIRLTAGHKFRQFVESLTEGDVIGYVAAFHKHPIKYPPTLRALQLQCISCKSAAEFHPVSDISYSGLWTQVYYAFKFLFNFLFAPLFMIEL